MCRHASKWVVNEFPVTPKPALADLFDKKILGELEFSFNSYRLVLCSFLLFVSSLFSKVFASLC